MVVDKLIDVLARMTCFKRANLPNEVFDFITIFLLVKLRDDNLYLLVVCYLWERQILEFEIQMTFFLQIVVYVGHVEEAWLSGVGKIEDKSRIVGDDHVADAEQLLRVIVCRHVLTRL